MGACLKQQLQHSEDFVARYGGEEFIIVVADKTQPEAHLLALQTVRAVASLALPHEKSSVPEKVVTISIGMHWQPRVLPVTTPAALIAQADAALYQAKRRGKIRCGSAICPRSCGNKAARKGGPGESGFSAREWR